MAQLDRRCRQGHSRSAASDHYPRGGTLPVSVRLPEEGLSDQGQAPVLDQRGMGERWWPLDVRWDLVPWSAEATAILWFQLNTKHGGLPRRGGLLRAPIQWGMLNLQERQKVLSLTSEL